MPFGEEIVAMAETHRTPGDKYGVGDGVRQKFTGYERDEETGLDFAEARYYYNNHGRFTAVDPLLASGKSADPQTFNRYAYTMNRPLILTDPTGLQAGTQERHEDAHLEEIGVQYADVQVIDRGVVTADEIDQWEDGKPPELRTFWNRGFGANFGLQLTDLSTGSVWYDFQYETEVGDEGPIVLSNLGRVGDDGIIPIPYSLVSGFSRNRPKDFSDVGELNDQEVLVTSTVRLLNDSGELASTITISYTISVVSGNIITSEPSISIVNEQNSPIQFRVRDPENE